MADTDTLFPGTFYLTDVDEKHRRKYERKPLIESTCANDEQLCIAKTLFKVSCLYVLNCNDSRERDTSKHLAT